MARYLCPVCRAPRSEELHDDLSFGTHVKMSLSILALAALCYLAKGWALAIKSLFFYLPLWCAMEFFHWVRMRQATKCATCAFDPILYQKDWKAARRKVEERLGQAVSELQARTEEKKNEEKKKSSARGTSSSTTDAAAPARKPDVPPPSAF